MKERLTGAIILVVLIVLLVPELLSGPKGPAATPPAAGAASPSSEEPPLRSYTINLGDDSHSQSDTANGATGSSGPPQPTMQAATPEKDLTESSSWDTSTTTDSQADNPNSVPANAAASSAAGEQPRQHMAAPPTSTAASSKAAKPSTSAAAAPKANQPAPNGATRAESPKASASSAAAARSNQPALDGAARVESPKPSASLAAAPKANQMTRTAAAETAAPKSHQPAPAAGESGGLVVSGWGVQLGVFASKENAERLALDVRTKGFKVSVSPVTSGKRKLYRVRVGPAADKSAAQDLQSKLKAAGRPGGTVVPYS